MRLLFRNGQKKADRLCETDLVKENFDEDDLREWMGKIPEIFFFENMMIIGRETRVQD